MAREETVDRVVGERYTLLETLGRGGMGTVWRAHDELLQRQVAVKHVPIPPGLEGSEQASTRNRVMREAQAAARLSHAASVTVFDVLEDDGSVYIVMELVEADNLSDLVARQGPLAAPEAAQLGLELVGALEAAHHQGIVHRDVKPSNVMMLPSGAVKLTDFGIASLKDHPSLTGTGQVLGSPSYMAPEQALGQASGEEVDWWGLGATLYFAVEGRPPFDRPGALATLTAVVNENPAPAEQAGALAPLLGRLLAKEPHLRPGAAELRKFLRRYAGSGTGGEPGDGERGDGERGDGDRGLGDTDSVEDGGEPAVTTRPLPPPPRQATAPEPIRPPSAAPVPTPPPADPIRREPPPARRPSGRAVGEPRPARRPSGRAVAALLAAVALLVGLIAWSSRTGDDSGDGNESETTSETAAGNENAGNENAGNEKADDTAGSSNAGVPADWVTYTDPKVGYRVAHPPGWQVRVRDGTRTDITDPATGSYLRLDWTSTPGPSPEGAWEAQSKSFGARHDGYEEIRIEPTTYKGFDAALWEYAYSSSGGRLHAVNLGMVTGKHGFALNFQTPEERWAGSQPLFEAFKASFEVPR